jgi:hypothetical protein
LCQLNQREEQQDWKDVWKMNKIKSECLNVWLTKCLKANRFFLNCNVKRASPPIELTDKISSMCLNLIINPYNIYNRFKRKIRVRSNAIIVANNIKSNNSTGCWKQIGYNIILQNFVGKIYTTYIEWNV